MPGSDNVKLLREMNTHHRLQRKEWPAAPAFWVIGGNELDHSKDHVPGIFHTNSNHHLLNKSGAGRCEPAFIAHHGGWQGHLERAGQ